MIRSGSPAHVYFAITGAKNVPGGIAALNLNILRALVDRTRNDGWQLHVLSYLERDEDRPDFLPASVGFRGFDSRKVAFGAQLVRAALRRPLFFFDHVTLALPVLPFIAVRWVRAVVFAHGSESWRHVKATSRWIFQRADLCLTNSRYTLRKMQERLPPFPGEACPLGLSSRFILNECIPDQDHEAVWLEGADGERHPLEDRVFLLVGRIMKSEPGKGRRALIRALPALAEYCPRAQLVFPGPGDEIAELKEQARQLGVGSSVFLPGFVSTELLETLYRQCFAYVMPSKQEGFGLVYLEAMNYGKPCVGCFDDGAEDVIVDGITGYLIRSPDDRQELLGVLRRLVDHPEQATEMGRRGFERLHARFTADHFQRRFQENLDRAL